MTGYGIADIISLFMKNSASSTSYLINLNPSHFLLYNKKTQELEIVNENFKFKEFLLMGNEYEILYTTCRYGNTQYNKLSKRTIKYFLNIQLLLNAQNK